LLVGGDCELGPDGAIPNAVVIDDRGDVLRRFVLGHGVIDVRALRDGTIWASYGEEGVYGNVDWGGPTGPEPIGSAGLVAFSPTGQRVGEYDRKAARTSSIVDVYATNLDGDDLWIYFYFSFSLVRVRRDTYQAWRCAVAGAYALAVRGTRVLLLGEHGRPGVARILELGDDGTAAVVEERELVDDSGARLDNPHARGTGGALHIFSGDRGDRILVVDEW
jgi:hypothetical protein